MKLTLHIKLNVTDDQASSLLKTMNEANMACNEISKIAFSNGVFSQFKLHSLSYYPIKNNYNLSAQMVVRCIGKVAESYKKDKKVVRVFKKYGGIAYDCRILKYKDDVASIWSVDGRLYIPIICHNKSLVPHIKGEADLVYKKGKFYLFQTCEVPEEPIDDIEGFIGCDFGQTDICTLSNGATYSSDKIKKVRKNYIKIRSSVQRKGTKGAKKLLKRLSGREHRFVTITNHTISKAIVISAKSHKQGIAIENLTNIRTTAKKRHHSQRKELHRWSFYQLREFIEYKARRYGVELRVVPPAYTSQTCSSCFHIGNRNGKKFDCINCGNVSDADVNAAKNIATWGCVISQPEKSSMFSCAIRA